MIQLASFIWSICNLLRGPYKRNEYRKVILPLHGNFQNGETREFGANGSMNTATKYWLSCTTSAPPSTIIWPNATLFLR